MRQISNAFHSRLYTDNYRSYLVTAYLTLTDGTNLTITNSNLWERGLVVDEATSSDDTLDIGSAIINECQLIIANLLGVYNSYVFEGAKVVPYVGLELSNASVENIKLGEYYVSRTNRSGSTITLVCYDNMAKFDRPISTSNLTYPATLNAIIADACNVCNVPLATQSIPHGTYSVKAKPDAGSTTFRNLISWAGQIAGVNAKINVDGELEFFWYDDTKLNAIINGQEPSGIHIFTSSYTKQNLSLSDIVVTQINVSEEVQDEDGHQSIARYTFGNTGYTISIEDNKLVQDDKGEDIAQWLYNDLNGFRYRKASLSVQSDPSIQAGDIAKIYDTKGNYYAIIVSSTTFQPGATQPIISSGAEPEQTSVIRSSIQTQNYVGLMVALGEERAARNNAEATIIERIDANVAEIGYLRTDVAQIGVLQADVASFETATALNFSAVNARIDTIETDDLTALNASIGTLQSDYANITTILSGNIGSGQLQTINLTSQNTTIGNSFVDQLIANIAVVQSLVAGSINTDDVTISSADGSLVITGSTQQFKDDNGTVRLQLGLDGQNNYSFSIYDENGNPLWYNDGITGGAIPDGIIVDDMVASASNSYSGISANKLNIQSVKGAIEQGGFSSSSIIFDDTQQTLTQVYVQMSSDITDASDLALQAKSSADSTAGQLTAIRQMISEIDTLEGMTLALTNDAHVVHTYYDGTGGDYSKANTTVEVFVGETNVTSYALITYETADAITGTWNNTTKTYQITNLSANDGWVDFNAVYGSQVRYLLSRSGYQYLTRSGNKLKLPSGAAHLSKRFSISKAPDGRVGTSYDLNASVLVMVRNSSNVLTPSSVTFSAIQNDGTGTADYSGYFKIEETTDNSTYTTKYTSASAETSTSYVPSAGTIKGIRCTLMDASDQILDIQSIAVIADADGMQADLVITQEAVQTVANRVGQVETGINGLRVDLAATNTTIQGISDGTLLFQTPFSWSNDHSTVNLRAIVYKAGQDATDDYPARWFKWYLRTEAVEELFATGKTASINRSRFGYGGTIIGRFTTYDIAYLTTRSGKYLTTRSGNKYTIYA